jgi:hypothetical protein
MDAFQSDISYRLRAKYLALQTYSRPPNASIQTAPLSP